MFATDSDKFSAFDCVLVENSKDLSLCVRSVTGEYIAENVKDGICICCVEKWEDEPFSQARGIVAETGDILFLDKHEWLCTENVKGIKAKAIFFDMQIFNACNFGLLGERVAAFLQLLSGVNYCYTVKSSDYMTVNRIFHNIFESGRKTDEDLTESVMAALWTLTGMLKNRPAQKDAGEIKTDRQNKMRLMPVLIYLNENYSSKITLMDMASRVNMSVPNFSAVFRKTMGMPPVEFLIRLRIQNATYQIKNTDKKIIDIAQDCGFTSISNFIKAFHRYNNVTPVQYRASGGGKTK